MRLSLKYSLSDGRVITESHSFPEGTEENRKFIINRLIWLASQKNATAEASF